MVALGLCPGDIVSVKGDKGKDTLLVVLTDDNLEDSHARMSNPARDNAGVRLGDMITVQNSVTDALH